MASVRGFTPNANRILIEPVKVAEILHRVQGTETDLTIPEKETSRAFREGLVLEVGPDVELRVETASSVKEDPKRIRAYRRIAPNDVVVYPGTGGADISRSLGEKDGSHYLLLEGEIVGIRAYDDADHGLDT